MSNLAEQKCSYSVEKKKKKKKKIKSNLGLSFFFPPHKESKVRYSTCWMTDHGARLRRLHGIFNCLQDSNRLNIYLLDRIPHVTESGTVLDLRGGQLCCQLGSESRPGPLGSGEGSLHFLLGSNANNLIGFPNTAQKPVLVLPLSPGPTATCLTRSDLSKDVPAHHDTMVMSLDW